MLVVWRTMDIRLLRIVILFVCLTAEITVLESRKIENDLVYQEGAAVRHRMTEVRQFLLPMAEQQWDKLIRHYGGLLIPINAASDVCRNHSQHLLNSFLEQEIWALRMVDASSKLGLQSGILDGNLHNLGNYAECISVEEPNHMFRGQHCVLETTGILPKEIADIVIPEGYSFVGHDGMFSLCVPSSCTDHDVHTHADIILSTVGARSKPHLDKKGLPTDIKQISCSSVDGIPFRTKDYCAMFVFASLILVVMLATITGAKSGWLSCFSLPVNFKELMDTSAPPGDISCLSGLKIILILQVMLVHRTISILFLPTQHFWTVLKMFGSFTMTFVEAGVQASDMFFLLGGVVLSYKFLMKTRRKEDFNYLTHVFKRYSRVTPVLAAVALFDSTLLIHSSFGPLWLRKVAEFENRCNVNWWSSLLHISNFVNPRSTCVTESWHLACDFQLQCLAPLVLLVLVHRPRLGMAITALCVLLSTAAKTAAAFYLQLSSGYLVSAVFWDRLTDLHISVIYLTPILRAHAFFMGLALGYLMFYFRHKKGYINLPKRTAWLGWTVTVVVFVGLMLVHSDIISPDHQYAPLLDPLFVGLSRQISCACLSWLIFACHFGCGGLINSFLSWPGFRPLSKLVFSMSLVHIILQVLQLASIQSAVRVNYMEQLFLFFGDVVASSIVGAVMYTTVELPFAKLSQRFIKDLEGRSKKTKKQ